MTHSSTLLRKKKSLNSDNLWIILNKWDMISLLVFLSLFNSYRAAFPPSAANYSEEEKCFGPSTTASLPTTYPHAKKKKCPNHKEGTPTNNKDNLTVMLSVIFRFRQCGLSFLIWLSLSKQHYDLCLCRFVAFGYVPNAANKSGLIS